MNWLNLKTPLKIRTRLVLASALQLGLLLALLAWQQAAEQAAAQGLQAPLSAAQVRCAPTGQRTCPCLAARSWRSR